MLEIVTPQLPLWSDRDATEGWLVRESERARRLTVRVFHSGRVEVVVPSRTSPRTVERFLERHRGWIERKREEAKKRAIPPAPFPPPRIELAASSENWRLHLVEAPPRGGLGTTTCAGNDALTLAGGAHRVRLQQAGDGLLILSGDTSDGHGVRLALRRWLTDRATEVLAPALDACARECGFEFERVLVRRQRTRWGSCSTRGTVSLNCCLMFQRPQVVRYLLIHELVHTLHMNHSQRFWQRVQRHCPEYSALDRELLDGWRRVPQWVFGEDPAP